MRGISSYAPTNMVVVLLCCERIVVPPATSILGLFHALKIRDVSANICYYLEPYNMCPSPNPIPNFSRWCARRVNSTAQRDWGGVGAAAATVIRSRIRRLAVESDTNVIIGWPRGHGQQMM